MAAEPAYGNSLTLTLKEFKNQVTDFKRITTVEAIGS